MPSEPAQLFSPVTLMVFNRPKCTRRVLAEIRKAQPQRLYVIADAHRSDKPGERERCEEVRKIVDEGVDWDCEVRRCYAKEHMGCRARISSGLTWVFENEVASIILEDDCLPSEDYFRFSDEMLRRYADESAVMQVCGFNATGYRPPDNASYFFSRYNPIWGWATWRRAWQAYDDTMADWPAFRDAGGMSGCCLSQTEAARRTACYDLVCRRELDTWDYVWSFGLLQKGGLSIIPSVNLIENVGFGRHATHTVNPFAMLRLRRRGPMSFPIAHPHGLTPDSKHDMLYCKRSFGGHPVLHAIKDHIIGSK